MELVKCPQCGKENVSKNEIACPGCGYLIRFHFVPGSKKKMILQSKADIDREWNELPEWGRQKAKGFAWLLLLFISGYLFLFVMILLGKI